ncbi:UDP-glucose/GDP-mannose dehydrogenase family protein [Bacillus ginsengihumi]|uniref:UDP-glucose 6-dehydrogenase n=1 Tax=Heyndrickxia ginsengihumi TaxID=363870 RepID=A0A0A6VA30_9BACI|nr:UDP-glucose/GDP-mannose dehydrogenase family protein [Heyndrickxia ginsengihumi]KHD84373.1 UDP-glucose 6-dehydrogenase [Heyndrickxia ginsengihumi]MBE6185652.1 UDP-glucose/GDP-mannose dehydrogenase family protein [Bacillus sp. (in: firmicutes)]NEY19425.1 UDP-glucose/GDP-mannose dehydrogenase family protein [Heyndrickxia ginsengihumi]
MEVRKITVIGTGYVGLVSGTCFAEIGHEVTCCDINEEKISLLRQGNMPIYEPGLKELVHKNVSEKRLYFTSNIAKAIQAADIIYIAVGTPMSQTGEADLTFVKQVAKTIGENLNGYKVIVTKSTVPVGTGRLVASLIRTHSQSSQPFDIVSNPEFLREGVAIQDTMNMERAIIGASSEKAFQIIAEVHKPFNTKIVQTSVETAEMIKYAANAFLATKLSFINDIANICERVGADVTKVSEGIGLDKRIGHQFLQAGVGFGGSCFPKDTAALHHIAKTYGYDFKLIDAVIETNFNQRVFFVEKVEAALGSLQGKIISVLGLSFKPNTDDMRYAPSLDVIPLLREKGAIVKAYDPIAIEEAKKHIGYQCTYFEDLYETIENADACVILTDWSEIKELDLVKVKSLLRKPIIIDGRNLFDLNTMHEHDFMYVSIGRPVVRTKTPIQDAI